MDRGGPGKYPGQCSEIYTKRRKDNRKSQESGNVCRDLHLDNGIGINPGHYNQVFQRFYREAKAAKTEGLGIGLYLARQIITLQGGYIKVRSKEGCGTEFEVFLPRRAA